MEKSYQKRLGPPFKASVQCDNATGKDWTKSTKLRETEIKLVRQKRANTLKNTGDRFMHDKNAYKKYLNDPEGLPRLSILENHKTIMKIMNSNYIKGLEMEKKFHNRNQKDLMHD